MFHVKHRGKPAGISGEFLRDQIWKTEESAFQYVRKTHELARRRGSKGGPYSAEMDWREDNRHVSNGEQYRSIVTAAASHPISRQWKGYWQRRAA